MRNGLFSHSWKWIIPVIALMHPVAAENSWEQLSAVVNENIADTATVAPGPYSRLDAAIPFRNFRYPHLDTDLNVTFIADDPVKFATGEERNHGIYRSWSATGKLETLVKSGVTRNPEGNQVLSFILGLQMWKKDFVFYSSWKARGGGLYESVDGKLLPVAESHRPIPSLGNLQFDWVSYGAISGKHVLFSGFLPGEKTGLYVMDRESRRIRQLVGNDDKIPGQPDKKFASFSLQNWINEDVLIFRGDTVLDGDDEDTTKEGLAGYRGIYAYWLKDDPSLAKFKTSALTVIADPLTVIPGGDGRKFAQIRSAPGGDHVAAFTGGNGAFQGVYVWTPAGLRAVIDTQTALTGVAPGGFYKFDKWISLLGKRITFRALTSDGYEGIFTYDIDADRLALIVDTRQTIDGKTPKTFEIGGRAMVGNRFAFMARFTDGSSGIYLSTVPLQTFGRSSKP